MTFLFLLLKNPPPVGLNVFFFLKLLTVLQGRAGAVGNGAGTNTLQAETLRELVGSC